MDGALGLVPAMSSTPRYQGGLDIGGLNCGTIAAIGGVNDGLNGGLNTGSTIDGDNVNMGNNDTNYSNGNAGFC